MTDYAVKECTPEEVIRAIDAYRKAATEHSREALKHLIQAGEEQDLEPEWEDQDEETIMEAQMDVCRIYLRDKLPDFKSPRDLLRHFDDLVSRCGLDGVMKWHPDGNETIEARRDRYLNVLNRGLQENTTTHISLPAPLLSVPQEFKTLVSHVDSLLGLGLPYHRRAAPFFQGYTAESDADTRNRVLKKEDLQNVLTYLWPRQWEIATGWRTGGSNDDEIFVLLCRCEEEGRPWRWRYMYGAMGSQSSVYDDIPGFLEFYAHHLPLDVKNWFIPLGGYM